MLYAAWLCALGEGRTAGAQSDGRDASLEIKYTLNSEPKALTGDKSEGIKSRGAAEAFIRGFSPVKAEGEEFNVLILSYTRELSRPFKENNG